eukprot:Phypoly_transcript_05441.p1 GENE.Phypoly_transcript_05441~~Phypoly_transcript_05441.p1  ORF type:complete len:383 (+),score=51.98 Phypoly_transcript_05441:79-1149(+)
MACGNGKYGRLAQGVGNGNSIIQFAFCKSVEEKLQFTTISCGAGHTLALTTNRSVYAWGKCHFGQLGHGEENEDVHLPKKIEALEGKGVCGIGCGWSNSFAVGESGNLYAWGCGFYGALGTGNERSVYLPAVVPFFSETEISIDPSKHVAKIRGGSFHSAVITKSKKLFVFGRNTAGQLGLGHTMQKSVPTEVLISSKTSKNSSSAENFCSFLAVACGDEHTGMITEDGRVWLVGKGATSPSMVDGLQDKKAVAIDVGIHRTLVLDEKGRIYEQQTFGAPFEKLKIPAGNETVKYIACGETHSMCITTSGKLFTWGDNYCGKLGHRGSLTPAHVSSVTTPLRMVDAGSNHSFALLQ